VGKLAGVALQKIPFLKNNLDKPIGKFLTESNWFRRLTNKERGLIVQSIESMQKAGLKDAQILRVLKKQDMGEFEKFVAEKGYRKGEIAKEAVPSKEPIISEPVAKSAVEVKPTAVFKGWRETAKGDHIALYNVEGGRLDKSTVTSATLKKEGIEIPKTPTFEEWSKKPPEKPKIAPTIEEKPKAIGKDTSIIIDNKEVKSISTFANGKTIHFKDGSWYDAVNAKTDAEAIKQAKEYYKEYPQAIGKATEVEKKVTPKEFEEKKAEGGKEKWKIVDPETNKPIETFHVKGGFGESLKPVKFSGKIYHAATWDGLLNLKQFVAPHETINFATARNSNRVFGGSHGRGTVLVLNVKNKIGKYSPVDADSGKFYGWDEFRTSFRGDNDFWDKVEEIRITQKTYDKFKSFKNSKNYNEKQFYNYVFKPNKNLFRIVEDISVIEPKYLPKQSPSSLVKVAPKVKPTPKAKPPYHDYLNILLDEVKEGGVVRIPHEEGGYRRASTYPEFMQKKGWTGKEVARAIELELKGEKLGVRQQEIVDAALSEAKERYRHDVEEYAKIREEAIEEAKADGIKERDLEESLKREITDEIAKEAEFAKAERESIQRETNSFFEEDISFKPEEIEKPTQTTILKAKPKFKLKAEEAPPKLRGRGIAEKELRQQFIQRQIKHLEDRLKKASAKSIEAPALINQIAKLKEGEFDYVTQELWEEYKQKAKPTVTFPTEKIKTETTGEQVSLLPKKKGEQITIEEKLSKKEIKKRAISGRKIPPRPLVNPHASALKQDKQLRRQQAWDKKYGEMKEEETTTSGVMAMAESGRRKILSKVVEYLKGLKETISLKQYLTALNYLSE